MYDYYKKSNVLLSKVNIPKHSRAFRKREKKIYFHISFYDAHDPIVLMPRL